MTDTVNLPRRRYKLPSELDPTEREQQATRGGDQVERDEYVIARRQILRDGSDDDALLVRLRREEAEALRAKAGRIATAGLESMSVEDWATRQRQRADDVPPLPGATKAAELRERAAQLDADADELDEALAVEAGDEDTVQDHIDRMRRNPR